jgi:hypothetical protein
MNFKHYNALLENPDILTFDGKVHKYYRNMRNVSIIDTGPHFLMCFYVGDATDQNNEYKKKLNAYNIIMLSGTSIKAHVYIVTNWILTHESMIEHLVRYNSGTTEYQTSADFLHFETIISGKFDCTDINKLRTFYDAEVLSSYTGKERSKFVECIESYNHCVKLIGNGHKLIDNSWHFEYKVDDSDIIISFDQLSQSKPKPIEKQVIKFNIADVPSMISPQTWRSLIYKSESDPLYKELITYMQSKSNDFNNKLIDKATYETLVTDFLQNRHVSTADIGESKVTQNIQDQDPDIALAQKIINDTVIGSGGTLNNPNINELKKLYSKIFNSDGMKIKVASYNDIDVYIVDGNWIKITYSMDFVEGDNWMHSPEFVPKHEVWVDSYLNIDDFKFIALHEIFESILMSDSGLEYDPAHERANKVEHWMREQLA